MLDRLDIGIIRELVTDPSSLTLQADIRRSYRPIAQKLEVSEDTVRNRIRAFEEAKFIRGWRVGINPSLLGHSATFIFFDVRPEGQKLKVLEEMRSLPGVMWFAECFENHLGATVAHRDSDSLKKIIDRIFQISNAETLIHGNVKFPNCDLLLSELDWKIVESIQREPRREYSQIGKELNASTRTVKRRIDKMIHEKALFVLPDLNLKDLQGSIAVNLTIFYNSPEVKQEVDSEVVSRFSEFLILAHLTDTEHGWYVLLVPNLSKVEEIRIMTTSLPGAKSVLVSPLVNFCNMLGEVFRDELKGKSSGIKVELPVTRPLLED